MRVGPPRAPERTLRARDGNERASLRTQGRARDDGTKKATRVSLGGLRCAAARTRESLGVIRLRIRAEKMTDEHLPGTHFKIGGRKPALGFATSQAGPR